ncbi:RNA polymerase sigma factor [Labedaea rhizosphaerae]|uniref:RNA polymerase sigma-70 factor (Sigma-E family) n=1 Tax=Labedaea rhizosphaerae TaxID=598644 RepID=A0A4R6SQ44_LABRH|nr:SigE family RNA polymerase sigma factor [Labedaea rhizosphaerae]TDQ05383.1 RNA polymerase sigma-70 factor (sigma-E family) [Labedaea rhizosphaerae]
MKEAQARAFREFAVANAGPLRRSAYLFCGDWHFAEDLMQASLVKVYRAWSRVQRQDRLGNYARQVLLRTWLDEKRKPWRRAEFSATVPDTPDVSADPDERAQRDWTRDVVRTALLAIPPKQRAVVVLRYFDDLSVAETAQVMRCSEGTVKSQTARGLDALRAALRAGGHADLVERKFAS